MQIDVAGDADDLPFGINGPPYVVARVELLEGELARYSVRSNTLISPETEEPNFEEEIIQSARVPERIIRSGKAFHSTIHDQNIVKGIVMRQHRGRGRHGSNG